LARVQVSFASAGTIYLGCARRHCHDIGDLPALAKLT